MYLNAIKYKEFGWLAPGSEAMALYVAKKFDALDKHCKALSEAKDKLEGVKRGN